MAKKKKILDTEDINALKAKLLELYESFRVLKFKTQGAKSKNVKEAGSIKKEIARILTKLNVLEKNK